MAIPFTALCASWAWAGDVRFLEIGDPSFVHRGPGADGRVGTGDDDDFSVGPFMLNGSGSASWIYASDLPVVIPGGGNELLQLGDGNGWLRMANLPSLDRGGLVDVFAFEVVDDLTGNPIFDVPDLLPHAFQVFPGGSFLFAYTVRTCLAGDSGPDDCSTLVLENDISGGGWIWRVDRDPRDLPDIDSFPVPGLPEYMELLETLTPEDTTMLALLYFGPLELTADNTRGALADSSIGGSYVAFFGGYSTDEPPGDCPEPADLCGSSAELTLTEKLVVEGKGKEKAKTGLSVEFGPGTWVGRADDGRRFGGAWKRGGRKDRSLKLFLAGGSPLSTFPDAASAFAEQLLGDKAVPIPGPDKIVLELNRKSTRVKPSRAKRTSHLRIGRKDRKAAFSAKLAGEIEAPE
ncbi:MAG: hypothetical protein ACQGVK_06235 [Myxococcota bacterium]